MITRLHRKRDSAEYQRVHKWVYINLGKADHCENDLVHTSSRFHWANLSGQYKTIPEDWKQLCPSCHKSLDGTPPHQREAIRLSATGNGYHNKAIFKVYPNGSWIKYASGRIASEANNISKTAINNVLRGHTRTAGGFGWRYVGRV